MNFILCLLNGPPNLLHIELDLVSFLGRPFHSQSNIGRCLSYCLTGVGHDPLSRLALWSFLYAVPIYVRWSGDLLLIYSENHDHQIKSYSFQEKCKHT